jgi:hypothetical protein
MDPKQTTISRRGKALAAAALAAATLSVGGAITFTGHSPGGGLSGGLATAAADHEPTQAHSGSKGCATKKGCIPSGFGLAASADVAGDARPGSVLFWF